MFPSWAAGAWTFLWFICFCVLANQWSRTTDQSIVATDAAQAVIAFSFFSIITWVSLSHHALGVVSILLAK